MNFDENISIGMKQKITVELSQACKRIMYFQDSENTH